MSVQIKDGKLQTVSVSDADSVAELNGMLKHAKRFQKEDKQVINQLKKRKPNPRIRKQIAEFEQSVRDLDVEIKKLNAQIKEAS